MAFRHFLATALLIAGAPASTMTNETTITGQESENADPTAYYKTTIDRNGRGKNCEITKSSGSEKLDALTCEVVTNQGRWSPKLDRRGAPRKSTFRGHIRWKDKATDQPH